MPEESSRHGVEAQLQREQLSTEALSFEGAAWEQSTLTMAAD
jgi:hypothetical protein